MGTISSFYIMKFFTFGACVALVAAGTVSVRDGETPHDPEAMAFCQGREDGYYSNPKDCGSYFFCWNNGHTGDKYFCAPGLAWHQRLLQCDWPYNLDESEPCYQPLN